MYNYTDVRLSTFQGCAVRIQVFVEGAQNPHEEGGNKGTTWIILNSDDQLEVKKKKKKKVSG